MCTPIEALKMISYLEFKKKRYINNKYTTNKGKYIRRISTYGQVGTEKVSSQQTRGGPKEIGQG